MNCRTTELGSETIWQWYRRYASMWILQTIATANMKHMTADYKLLININAFHRHIVKVSAVKIVCCNYNYNSCVTGGHGRTLALLALTVMTWTSSAENWKTCMLNTTAGLFSDLIRCWSLWHSVFCECTCAGYIY